MKKEDINILLEKYWEGETTLEEEKIIKKHLAKENNQTSTLFKYFENEKNITYEGKMPDKDIAGKKEVKVINFSIKKIAIAASIIFLIATVFFIGNNRSENSAKIAKTEIKNKDEAMKLAEEALQLLAMNIEKGKKSASMNLKELDRLNTLEGILN